MRAFAAAQFTLTRFGVWRAVVGALSLVVLLASGAWLVSHRAWELVGWLPCVGMALALSTLLFALQPRPTPLSLRCDAQRWHLGPAASVGHEPWAGELRVAIDLGPWMLLRFTPDGDALGAGPTWLPVQRRGLEPQWHALRCAVYSPRPDVGVNSAPDV